MKATTQWNEAEPPFLGMLSICYQSSIFRLLKMFQFDSHILNPQMYATGNLRLQKHARIEDKQGGSFKKGYLDPARQLKYWLEH